jgi:hypothetical protein
LKKSIGGRGKGSKVVIDRKIEDVWIQNCRQMYRYRTADKCMDTELQTNP